MNATTKAQRQKETAWRLGALGVLPNRSFRWGPTLLVASFLALYLVVTRPAPVLEEWGTDYSSALSEAAATGQKVLVAFYTHGCPPCVAMDRRVLSKPAVRSALEGFAPVRVDMDRQSELAERFGVLATPTYAVVDADGRVLARCEGYLPVESFLKFLEHSPTLPADGPAPTGPHQPNEP